MKVRRKIHGTTGVVADSAKNTSTHLIIVWDNGTELWTAMEMVSNLIFIVPAPTRRINNA